MSKALMELIPRLIPGGLSPQVNATLASVRFESNNGYDYLWRVLELTVPGFDPTVPICFPNWSDVVDIFHFAQAFLLYFWLQDVPARCAAHGIRGHHDNPSIACELVSTGV
jgi:hypothetical protein